MLALFIGHYLQRTFIYPCLINTPKPTSLSICSSAFAFCTWNGSLQGIWLTQLRLYPDEYIYGMSFIAGTVIFLTGMLLNIQSDSILRNLRKGGEKGYKIPHGGLYNYVSCGNFLGEEIEWIGWAILTQSVCGVAFAVNTFLNLAPRASQHHQWYVEKFEDYPKNRKRLIPFVW